MKKCQFCAEDIKVEAILCKHCGKEVGKIDLENTEEHLIYETKPHWINYILPIVLCLTIYLLPIGLYYIYYFKKKKIYFTNKRFIHEYGILNKQTKSLKISKIESVSNSIDIISSMFGTGKTIITLTGGKKEIINNVDKPNELKNNLDNLLK